MFNLKTLYVNKMKVFYNLNTDHQDTAAVLNIHYHVSLTQSSS